jgi:hypothetical protein
VNTRAARLASQFDVDRRNGRPKPCKTAMPGSDRFDGQTKWPAGPAEAAGGRAFGARERGLKPRGVDGSSHRQLGRTPQVERCVRNRRPTPEVRHSEAFAETRSPPCQLRHKLAAIIDRLAFLMKPAKQKRRRRYSNGAGKSRWSWEEENSNPRRESKCALHEIQAAP